jgi:hypothetical protein
MRVFDGEDLFETSKAEISKFSPDHLVDVFESTVVYFDLLSDLRELISAGIVTNVSDHAISPEVIAEVKAGVRALTLQLDTTFGTDSAAMIWARVVKSIEEAKV